MLGNPSASPYIDATDVTFATTTYGTRGKCGAASDNGLGAVPYGQAGDCKNVVRLRGAGQGGRVAVQCAAVPRMQPLPPHPPTHRPPTPHHQGGAGSASVDLSATPFTIAPAGQFGLAGYFGANNPPPTIVPADGAGQTVTITNAGGFCGSVAPAQYQLKLQALQA